MSGPKRNPDRLNTIGIVVVGICGAVLVYVTIVALQAFYVNDTSEVQTIADYGGQELGATSLRTEQVNKINDWGSNPRQPPKAGEAPHPQSYRIPVDVAMKRVVADAKTDPGVLIPTLGRSDKATVQPIFGRPKVLATAPAAAAAAPAAGQVPGAPGAPAAGAPAAGAPGAATDIPAAPQVPTGAGTGPSPVGGAGPLDSHPATPVPKAPAAAAPAPAAAAPLPAVPARPRQSGAPKGNGK